MASRGTYVFDNAGAQAGARFSALGALFDPGTIRHLTELGVAEGWHCLEVGVGGGSIATWLCDRVGAQATSSPPTSIPASSTPRAGRTWRSVDTTWRPIRCQKPRSISPMPTWFWCICPNARLPCSGRARLKPGGWLLVEEFDSLSMRPDPAIDPDDVLLETYDALQRLMTARGVDLRYGRLLTGRFRAHGLVDVGAEGRLFMLQGGSPGAALYTANFEQVRDAMVQAALVTNEQVDADLRRLEEQRLIGPSPIMWAAWGRRP